MTLINDDLRAGQHAAAYMSLLYFFLGGSLSLADAVRRGEIKAGQARRAEGALFDALGPLTARFGARLEQRLRMDAVPLLQTAPPQALPPELQALLDDILAEMKTVFDAITPEIYAVLAGGA
ncbi:MAG: hypothetical protein HYV26_19065 [Candidatus Hydrogenedentes bacterium]|nr:hypothetical protein [Candidatus Hydrogenedentota bacterium]